MDSIRGALLCYWLEFFSLKELRVAQTQAQNERSFDKVLKVAYLQNKKKIILTEKYFFEIERHFKW